MAGYSNDQVRAALVAFRAVVAAWADDGCEPRCLLNIGSDVKQEIIK